MTLTGNDWNKLCRYFWDVMIKRTSGERHGPIPQKDQRAKSQQEMHVLRGSSCPPFTGNEAEETMLIELNKKRFAIIDDSDAWVAEHKWHFKKGYVARTLWFEGGRQGTLYLHRAIMNPPPGVSIDHINGDPLDNRRSNLRVATQSQNNMNQRPKSGRKFKGITWNRSSAKWQASIKVDGRFRYLGVFETQELAAAAYDTAARELFGEFALTNRDLGVLP